MTRTWLIFSIRLLLLSMLALWLGVHWYVVLPVALVMPPLFSVPVVCGCCTDSNAQMQLDFTGITNGTCSTCANYNTSFIVDRAVGTCDTGSSPNGCNYAKSMNGGIGGGGFCLTNESVNFCWSNSASPGSRAYFTSSLNPAYVTWANGTGSTSQDCTTSPGAIAYTSVTGSSGHCVWSSSSVTATVL